MKKALDYFLSIIYVILFSLFLLIFHPIQLLAYYFFSKKAQQVVVHWLNFFLFKSIWVTGSKVSFKQYAEIPTGRPIIFVSNHQSMFDIIGIIWLMRHFFPIFVSKIELSKKIPSISLNLRLSGAALIDRNDNRQAIPEIARMAKHAVNEGFSPVIFPEGTRSKTDQLKPFALGGLAVLLKYTKNALIVPIAIKGNNKLNPKGFFPYQSFTKISYHILSPIEPNEYTNEALIAKLEEVIRLDNQ